MSVVVPVDSYEVYIEQLEILAGPARTSKSQRRAPLKPIVVSVNKTSKATAHMQFKGTVLLDVAGARRELQFDRRVNIGRGEPNTIAIANDVTMSAQHASLYAEGEHVMIADCGSANGTFLNGCRISRPERVADGDQVQLGQTVIRIYF